MTIAKDNLAERPDRYLSNAHTAEDEAVKNSGVSKSTKVVLGKALGGVIELTFKAHLLVSPHHRTHIVQL